MLIITMFLHVLNATYCYVQFNQYGSFSFAISVFASGSLAAVGVWVLMFGTGEGHRSRRTGADKRVSGWLFPNEAAEKKKGKKF